MDMTHHRLKDHLDKQEGSIREVRDKKDIIEYRSKHLRKQRTILRKS